MSRAMLRRLKARAIRFQASAPPVVIMALRRGGSTMVTDAVSASPGVWFADEPYAMFPGRPGMPDKAARLFTPMHSHFFALQGDEAARWDRFGHALLNGAFKDMGTCRRTTGLLGAHRSCLKVLNAPWMLPWFQDQTAAHLLCLLRHPGAQAQSTLRLGWDFAVEAYLARPEVLADHFSPDQIAVAQAVFASGDRFRIAVLDWIVSSHPLRQAKGRGVVRLRYEDIVAKPEDFVRDVLVGTCGLTDQAAMIAALTQPSGSLRMNTAAATQAIQSRDLDKMIHGWRAKTTPDQMVAGQALLDQFKITDYRFD